MMIAEISSSAKKAIAIPEEPGFVAAKLTSGADTNEPSVNPANATPAIPPAN